MAHLTPHVALGPGAEFDLIRAMLDAWGDIAEGIGDDAALLVVPPGERLAVSTDSSVEEVHFRRHWITPEEIGYRATQAALSDLAAMAATPLGILVALSIPDSWRRDIGAMAAGIGEAAREAGAPIRGGDLTTGAVLSLTITVLGSASSPLGRGGVKPLDHLYVTGALGGPARAVEAWEAGEVPGSWCRERFARPRARVREARWLAARGAHAMIDISDGLASELRHLAHASHVELRIEVERLPCGAGGSWREALSGGEEYELVVCTPQELDVDGFARTFGIPLTRIGQARRAEHPAVTAMFRGERVDLTTGHDHFSS
ncbi:MAG: thiamine-phosphate kinase [Cytophagaceae bacterium]|nr:thiamine-phosphate kinase [Gemmatimonadaceae bacterium]